MSPLIPIDPRQPFNIDSFEFLYQMIAKDVSAIYVPVRDTLALLAGCYLLKKSLPIPYYIYRAINGVCEDHDQHWALINDCTTPSGCAFAQNLAVRCLASLSLLSDQRRSIV